MKLKKFFSVIILISFLCCFMWMLRMEWLKSKNNNLLSNTESVNEKMGSNDKSGEESVNSPIDVNTEKVIVEKLNSLERETIFDIIDIELTKEYKSNFNLMGRSRESMFYWDEPEVAKAVPYSEITDESWNLLGEVSYLLITIRIENRNYQWTDKEKYSELLTYALGQWRLAEIGQMIPFESKGLIRDERIDEKGKISVEPGVPAEVTLIFILQDKYINSDLKLLYIHPNGESNNMYFDLELENVLCGE